MVTMHPSLTLVLDLDERLATYETKAEIRRCYSHVGNPLVRTHAPARTDEGAEGGGAAEAPCVNRARFIVGLGAKRYLMSTDEGADALWNDVVAHWIGSMLYKVSHNMKAFNRRMRKIGLPELTFERFDIELQGGQFTVGLRPSPEQVIDRPVSAQVDLARALLNDGTLAGAVRVDAPGSHAWAAQQQAAQEAWDATHEPPEDNAGADAPEDGAEAANAPAEPRGPMKHYVGPMPDWRTDPEAYEEWARADIEAKSYENTAVPITDSDELPPIGNPVEPPEPERFDFDVDYQLWDVTFADGSVRAFGSIGRTFLD